MREEKEMIRNNGVELEVFIGKHNHSHEKKNHSKLEMIPITFLLIIGSIFTSTALILTIKQVMTNYGFGGKKQTKQIFFFQR